jgi:hypothetical protein
MLQAYVANVSPVSDVCCSASCYNISRCGKATLAEAVPACAWEVKQVWVVPTYMRGHAAACAASKGKVRQAGTIVAAPCEAGMAACGAGVPGEAGAGVQTSRR